MSARMEWLYHRHRNLPHSLYVEAFTSTRGVCFWGVSWCWGKAHPYSQAITGPLATTHNLFGSIVKASAKKNQKEMVVFSVSVDSIPNKNQAEMHGTALSSLHIIAQRLLWRILAQACRQDGKSSAISLWAATLVAWSPSSHPYGACRWRICVHYRNPPSARGTST